MSSLKTQIAQEYVGSREVAAMIGRSQTTAWRLLARLEANYGLKHFGRGNGRQYNIQAVREAIAKEMAHA